MGKLVSKHSLMARPTSISTEHIVDVARRLFLERGSGVATSAIAEAAGISEGTIFKRFPTKESLFLAAMGLPQPTFLECLPHKGGEGDVRDNLLEVAHDMLSFYENLMPRLMMMMTQGRSSPLSHFEGMDVPPPVRIIVGLAAYLDEEHQRGRLRCPRPELAAAPERGPVVVAAGLEVVSQAEVEVPG